jgi:hypothetical protein
MKRSFPHVAIVLGIMQQLEQAEEDSIRKFFSFHTTKKSFHKAKLYEHATTM